MQKCKYHKGCNEWVIKNEDELCYYHRKLVAGLLEPTPMEDLFDEIKDNNLEVFFENETV